MVEIITFNGVGNRIAMRINNSEITELLCHNDGKVCRMYFINFSIDIDREYTEIEIYQDGVDITNTIKRNF